MKVMNISWNYFINSSDPGKYGCKLKLVIFESLSHIKDKDKDVSHQG